MAVDVSFEFTACCLGRHETSVSPPRSRPLQLGTAVSWELERRRDQRRFGWSGRFAQRRFPALPAQHSPAWGERAALDSFYLGCPAAWPGGRPVPFLLRLIERMMKERKREREREGRKSALHSSSHPIFKTMNVARDNPNWMTLLCMFLLLAENGAFQTCQLFID